MSFLSRALKSVFLPLDGQVLRKVPQFSGAEYKQGESYDVTVAAVADANIITSEVAGKHGMHKPVIDLDMPARLVPSSTPGHYHLYIDKEMPWETYTAFLDACVVAGLVEPGYVGAAKARGYTGVRLPWVQKEAAPNTSDPEKKELPF